MSIEVFSAVTLSSRGLLNCDGVQCCARTSTRRHNVFMLRCLTKHHAMKMYWVSGGIAPHILNLATRWRRMVSVTHRALSPPPPPPRCTYYCLHLHPADSDPNHHQCENLKSCILSPYQLYTRFKAFRVNVDGCSKVLPDFANLLPQDDTASQSRRPQILIYSLTMLEIRHQKLLVGYVNLDETKVSATRESHSIKIHSNKSV
jgi:hypothetical protein